MFYKDRDDCEIVQFLIRKYFQGKFISPADHKWVKGHIQFCSTCQDYLRDQEREANQQHFVAGQGVLPLGIGWA